MGANQPGEIERICSVIKPNMGLITNIGNAHLANFESKNEISKTKSALFESLPSNGVAFINLDDPYILKMNILCSRIEYSLNTTADYQGKWMNKAKQLKIDDIIIDLSAYSKIMNMNSLAVYSIAAELGYPKSSISSRIESFDMPKGRGEMFKVHDYTIINDSYNANLESAKLGIHNLSVIQCNGRKITVIGDMLELGSKEKESHQILGKYLIDKKIDAVFAYGNLSKYIIQSMDGAKGIHQFYSDKKLLISDLKEYLRNGDTIYIKGSRGMGMEDVIMELRS